ncbi:alpha/beta hydrolase [Mesorhizobium sp. BR1-1-16]|uniref:alpha/beta fold hydrolase n=1 Tax=Mesorhizobium sp. BR1-1-16 TaxID=2876653 RepID=UPI001CCDF88E|nr:alpha/beta fold hydrolase [Mesorhizobium sp. BR1-1-16]MBZ9936914.1 alpha/beta hydrolase [Mesorhizobium sp. BR1-1-16]
MTSDNSASNVSSSTSGVAAEKPPVILVHGAFSSGLVWGHVAARLQAAGHAVVTVELPGRPSNPMASDKVSLELYRDTVLGALNNAACPAILVGHSFAGIVIAAAAEQAPEKIKTLVFVAAYLPQDGDSLLSLAQQDHDARIGPHLTIDKEHGIAVVDYAARAELFANDGPAPLKAKLPDLILDEPVAPLVTPVHVTEARFGQVEKVYVHTNLDQVISPAFQGRMVGRMPVRNSVTLQTGHLPFLTDPDGVATAIQRAAD